MNIVQKLRQLVNEIRRAPTDAKAQEAWELSERLLGRMPVEQVELRRIMKERDIPGLDAMVAFLESGDPASQKQRALDEARANASKPKTGAAVSEEEMSKALRAFRKRLKLTRLDDESQLRGRRLTAGKQSAINEIIPPHEFPGEVWEALASAGRLKKTGNGFYALP